MATQPQEEEWQRADDEVRKKLPPGVKLLRTLRGHTGYIGRIAWSPDGRLLASPSADETIRLWDAETGEQLMVDTHDAGFRKRFATAAEKREDELRQGFAEAGVDVLELATDDTLIDAVHSCAVSVVAAAHARPAPTP
jgi:WD40 repeat protein